MAENKVVLALRTHVLELKTATGSLVGSVQEVEPRSIDTKCDLIKAQEAVAVSNSQKTSLTEKVTSLTKERMSIRVERANLKPDLDEMTALV